MSIFNVNRHGEGYAIFDRNGERVSGVFSNQFVAENSVDHRLKQLKKHRRNCICCGDSFDSYGKQNRMCGSCRERTAEEDFQLVF